MISTNHNDRAKMPAQRDAQQKAIRLNCVPTKREFDGKHRLPSIRAYYRKLGVFHLKLYTHSPIFNKF